MRILATIAQRPSPEESEELAQKYLTTFAHSAQELQLNVCHKLLGEQFAEQLETLRLATAKLFGHVECQALQVSSYQQSILTKNTVNTYCLNRQGNLLLGHFAFRRVHFMTTNTSTWRLSSLILRQMALQLQCLAVACIRLNASTNKLHTAF